MQNRFQSYLNTSSSLIKLYDAKTPFSVYLKNYFAQHKKHGSTDRKNIAALCYSYFRLGNSLSSISTEEKIKIGFFICNDEPKQFNILFQESFLKQWSNELNQRIEYVNEIYPSFLDDVFTLKDELGNIENTAAFIKSHFIQPNLFLRIRPNKKQIVFKKLNDNHISFNELTAECLSLNNATKVNEVLEINKDVVVQDFSSQQTNYFIEIVKNNLKEPIRLWDCCAASGGKSILVNDIIENVHITVSDSRETIIHNLKKRFFEAGIKNYNSFIADISKSIQLNKTFNFIICDVPCSGSGTWARTPEQICNFNKNSLADFNTLQNSITNNVTNYLEKNGYLLYITCSVFKAENEDVVQQLSKKLQLVQQKYIEGYTNKADTMFAALFKKSN
jgi:16S rRNA (cytosine967-C5)-methyltransferase